MPLIASQIIVQSGEKCASIVLPGSEPVPLTVSERAKDIAHITIYADDQPTSPRVFPSEDIDIKALVAKTSKASLNDTKEATVPVMKLRRKPRAKR